MEAVLCGTLHQRYIKITDSEKRRAERSVVIGF